MIEIFSSRQKILMRVCCTFYEWVSIFCQLHFRGKLTVSNRYFYRESLPEGQKWACVFDMLCSNYDRICFVLHTNHPIRLV